MDEFVLGQPVIMKWHYRLHMRPVPKASIRIFKGGGDRGYYPKATTQAMKRIKAETLGHKINNWVHPNYTPQPGNEMEPIFVGPVKVSIIFSFKRPLGVPFHKRPYPSVVPDIDNLAKLTLDSIQPHIIKDDCLIVTLYKRKIYDGDYIDINIEDLL